MRRTIFIYTFIIFSTPWASYARPHALVDVVFYHFRMHYCANATCAIPKCIQWFQQEKQAYQDFSQARDPIGLEKQHTEIMARFFLQRAQKHMAQHYNTKDEKYFFLSGLAASARQIAHGQLESVPVTKRRFAAQCKRYYDSSTLGGACGDSGPPVL